MNNRQQVAMLRQLKPGAKCNSHAAPSLQERNDLQQRLSQEKGTFVSSEFALPEPRSTS